MSMDDWKDAQHAEETAAADVTDEEGVIEEPLGVVEQEDPFETAFQYTEPEQPRTSNWPVVVLALLMVAVLVGGVLWGTGAFDKKPKEEPAAPSFGTADISGEIAAVSGDVSLSNGAFAFFMEMEYQSSETYASYDKTQPLKSQNAAAFEQLVASAKTQFEWMVAMNASAKARGTTLNKAALNMIEKAVTSVDVSAFHNGVTSADVREFYTFYYTAWLEESALFNSLTLTEENVEDIFNEFPNDYQSCDVASYFFVVGDNGGYATIEEAQAAADRLAACDTPAAFRTAVIQHLLDAGECKDEEEAAELYDSQYTAEQIGYSEDYEITKWLFADDTAVGDTKMETNKDYVSVYMLIKAKSRNTTPLARLRYIHLSSDAYGDESVVKPLADEVLAAFRESDGSRAAFEALSRQYSANFNTYDGDSWEFKNSPSISKEAGDWCFDEARKEGDVTVVSSDSGYHILYFVDTVETWYAEVLTTAQSDAITGVVKEMPKTYPVTFDDTVIQKNEF